MHVITDPKTAKKKVLGLSITKNIPPRAMLVSVAEYPQSPKYKDAGDTPRPKAVRVDTADPSRAKALDIGLQMNMPTKISTPQPTSD